jgi:hypothetical protein
MRHRAGTGTPLLLFTPTRVAESQAWFDWPAASGRPLAILGANDMTAFASPPERVARDLLAVTAWQNVERLQVLGFSLGGFPALLFGACLAALLPRTRIDVLVLSPVVCLSPPLAGVRSARHAALLRAAEGDHRLRGALGLFGDTRPWVAAAAQHEAQNLKITLMFSSEHAGDIRQANHLAGCPGVTLRPVPTTQHWLGFLLQCRPERGHLAQAFFKRMLAEADPRPRAALLAEAHRAAAAVMDWRAADPLVAALVAAVGARARPVAAPRGGVPARSI